MYQAQHSGGTPEIYRRGIITPLHDFFTSTLCKHEACRENVAVHNILYEYKSKQEPPPVADLSTRLCLKMGNF